MQLFHINLPSFSISYIMTPITLDLLLHRGRFLPLLFSPSVFPIPISFLSSFHSMLYPLGQCPQIHLPFCSSSIPTLKLSHSKCLLSREFTQLARFMPQKRYGFDFNQTFSITQRLFCVYLASLCVIFQCGYFRFLTFLKLLTLMSLLAANLARRSQRKEKQENSLSS